MKNPLVIIAIIIVVAVVGFGVYTISHNSSTSDSMMEKDEAKMIKEDTGDEKMKKEDVMEDEKMMKDSRYVEYSKKVFDSSANNRRVLFFYASWCPTCIPTDKNLKENITKIPSDVTVIRVNYNDPETDQEEKDLAKEYGITYQHTFVQIDKSGKELAKWNGGQIDELLSKIK